MKTSIFNIIGSLLLVGTITVSCNSCNKDKDASANDTTVATHADSAEIDNTAVSSGAADAENIESVSGTTNANTGQSTKNTKAANSKNGYSAPDGTDAENNDGDMYTKNDTTRMPSGSVPIK